MSFVILQKNSEFHTNLNCKRPVDFGLAPKRVINLNLTRHSLKNDKISHNATKGYKGGSLTIHLGLRSENHQVKDRIALYWYSVIRVVLDIISLLLCKGPNLSVADNFR